MSGMSRTLRGEVSAHPLTLHALMVEDNATNQFVLSHFLQRMGITFDIAGHGAAALVAWEGGCYDLVLMDIEMPVLNGYDATRELRRRERDGARRRTPIIALSADALPSHRAKAESVGMDGFVTKPIDRDALREAILDATGRCRLQRVQTQAARG